MSIGGGFNPLSGALGKDDPADAARDAGRISAAAYGQGVDELRRQFYISQALLAPFVGAGTAALPGMAAAGTVGGFDQRIAEILGTDTFKALLGERERAVQGQLSAGGLMRSGAAVREAARVPTDLALAIEQALFGRQANLVNLGQASAAGQAAQGNDIAGRIAELMGRSGDARAQAIIGGQQAQAAQTGNLINAGASIAAAAIMFSDPRLKENMQPVGKIGPLTLYEWDWKPAVSKLIGRMNIGFSADEVQEHFPQHVAVVHGFKAINYPALTDELRERYCAGRT